MDLHALEREGGKERSFSTVIVRNRVDCMFAIGCLIKSQMQLGWH